MQLVPRDLSWVLPVIIITLTLDFQRQLYSWIDWPVVRHKTWQKNKETEKKENKRVYNLHSTPPKKGTFQMPYTLQRLDGGQLWNGKNKNKPKTVSWSLYAEREEGYRDDLVLRIQRVLTPNSYIDSLGLLRITFWRFECPQLVVFWRGGCSH